MPDKYGTQILHFQIRYKPMSSNLANLPIWCPIWPIWDRHKSGCPIWDRHKSVAPIWDRHKSGPANLGQVQRSTIKSVGTGTNQLQTSWAIWDRHKSGCPIWDRHKSVTNQLGPGQIGKTNLENQFGTLIQRVTL